MKGLKSENADTPFILQQILITPKKIENFKSKKTVIHGWDINILCPAYVFLEKKYFYMFFQRKSVLPTQGAKFEAKQRCRQQGPVCRGNQTGVTIVLNLEKNCISEPKLGPGNKGSQQ